MRGGNDNFFRHGLYDACDEKDACGIGMLVHSHAVASHEILRGGLQILSNLKHRGAKGADGRTSDGAGVLTQIPHQFLQADLSFELPAPGQYACGVVFVPMGQTEKCQGGLARMARGLGLEILGWRRVPVDAAVLGEHARALEPIIYQVFISNGQTALSEFDRALYVLRRKAESHLRQTTGTRHSRTGEVLTQFYLASLSTRTMVLKGLMLPEDLGAYFLDLQDPRFVTALALVHSRFSTNTLPAWELAQPFRALCHNGEINTLRGNLNFMKAREQELASTIFPEDPAAVRPLIGEGQSDSACLDQAAEIMQWTGRSLAEAVMCLVPEAWELNSDLDPSLRDFYAYHASRMEPWDGPAALCFTDGRIVAATLDRNGLRPCRYRVMEDGVVMAASEAGCLHWPHAKVVRRGRLAPGEMLVVDLEKKICHEGRGARVAIARQRPYAALRTAEEMRLVPVVSGLVEARPVSVESLLRFGYDFEDLKAVLSPMMVSAEEPASSMGNDTPPAILSDRPQLLYKYFRQLFAQVTNPPIDPIREQLVMSLTTYLRSGGTSHKLLRLEQPFLDLQQMAALETGPASARATARLDMTWARGGLDLRVALRELCARAEDLARQGIGILVFSDRTVSGDRTPLPALLVTSAVHTHLIQQGLRPQISLVVETGEAREVHHFACLLAFGADAIHPYLALHLAESMAVEGFLDGTGAAAAQKNYIKAVCKGLLKVMSKMGVSTVGSYRGSQLFEIVGLGAEITESYFAGRRSRIGGLDLQTLALEIELRQAEADRLAAVETLSEIPSAGEIHFRAEGEEHLWDPMTIAQLQLAAKNNEPKNFQEFSARANYSTRKTFRGLLHPRTVEAILNLDDIEPAASIVKRFTTGAMSMGALSKEVHESLAIAMNRIGAKSNSGEGGEDAERIGTAANSAIKQVASARFGVTAQYLVSARELQIKIAQGAKPGEGGQLPGHKVDSYIAALRHSTPGVTLISPPPHHDVYSIEDLAQLIYDLKAVNGAAVVSVKLVASSGVGTVAAGVAKAHAEKITISGDGGGTGASPLSGIKYAGLPWELGLAEAHQTLVMNGLRGRVRLETDGQLRTGRDVVVAALLGADEFGFSTAPLIVQGCLMMRKCHLNTCPVGVATQDPELRAKFSGQPEHLINYFFFVAEEVREWMRRIGVKTFHELIGRTDLLEFTAPADHWKARHLDLAPLLTRPHSLLIGSNFGAPKGVSLNTLDEALLVASRPAIDEGRAVRAQFRVRNGDRAVGARLSGEIARQYGEKGLPEETIEFSFEGSAGQSFGAFLVRGVTLRLHGETNDYLGKSLSGGCLIVAGRSADEVIAGNTCLYGATAGVALIAGRAGERFAVRNSGATAVVEGIGDHGCEYMTGGRVIILGTTGRNFAAGMSGGRAYVYDIDGRLASRCNSAMVDCESFNRLDNAEDAEFLRNFLELHVAETGSQRAAAILAKFESSLARWVRILPRDSKSISVQKPRARLETAHG